jgi:hypothetical protein
MGVCLSDYPALLPLEKEIVYRMGDLLATGSGMMEDKKCVQQKLEIFEHSTLRKGNG